MKTFLILLGVGVAGYFGYEYFIANKNATPDSTGQTPVANALGIIQSNNNATPQVNSTTGIFGAQ